MSKQKHSTPTKWKSQRLWKYAPSRMRHWVLSCITLKALSIKSTYYNYNISFAVFLWQVESVFDKYSRQQQNASKIKQVTTTTWWIKYLLTTKRAMLQCYRFQSVEAWFLSEAMDKDRNRLQDNQVCGKGCWGPPTHPLALEWFRVTKQAGYIVEVWCL